MKFFTLSLLTAWIFGQVAAQSDSIRVAARSDSVHAAKPIVIEDTIKTMSKGNQPGFKINIDYAKKKGTVDALTQAMQENNNAKLELVNNEYITRGAIIKDISPKPLNVYTIVNEYEDHVELFFFYEEDSAFLSKEKNETEYLSARKYTHDFAVRASKGAVQERIDLENQKLKDFQSQLDDITVSRIS